MTAASDPHADNSDGLSDEQRGALEPSICLIEAGPGAGKTRTVVARLRARTASGERVALLSFTNAAIDVARSRCRDVPGLADPPNFVGTFDQFFHRYVVTPASRRVDGSTPTYLSSWDDLPADLSTVRPPAGGLGVRLSTFNPSPDGTWHVDYTRLSRPERVGWDKLTQWSRNQIDSLGTGRIRGLVARGVYDTANARSKALAILSDSTQPLLRLLARRFHEIVVDEFQDCDEVEYALLEQLREAGIHVVVVADPDQAIYEFRTVNTQLYTRFRTSLRPSEIANLTTCYRSAPAICSLVSALRSVGLADIVPDSAHVGGAGEIHVVVGSGLTAGKQALAIARKYATGGETRVISHARRDARALVRSGSQPPNGTSQMESLLAPLADLLAGGDAKTRLYSTRRLERFVLNQFSWTLDGETSSTKPQPSSTAQQLEALGQSPAALRKVVSQLSRGARTWSDRAECSADVLRLLQGFAATSARPLVGSVKQRLRVVDAVWTFWVSRTSGFDLDVASEVVRWGHIHGVKGAEFDAVVVVLPSRARANKPYVLDDWQNDINSEQRRVLYVGASRAKRVLVLVVAAAKESQLTSLLFDAGVPFTRSRAN